MDQSKNDWADREALAIIDVAYGELPIHARIEAISSALRQVAYLAWKDGMAEGYKAGKEPLYIPKDNPHGTYEEHET